MNGLLWGSTSINIHNSMIFVDKENSLKAHITFDSSSEKYKGSIYKFIKDKLNLDSSIPLSKNKDISFEIGQIKGCWKSDAYIDDN